MSHAAASGWLPAWRPLLDALGDAAWVVDAADLRVLACNAAASALLGLTVQQPGEVTADALIATPEDLAFWDQVRAGDACELCSHTVVVDRAGRALPALRRIRRIGQGDDAPYLVTVHDRSEVEREAEAREAALAELQATLESTGDGILVTDLEGRIRAFNRRFAQIWGLPEALLAGRDDDAVWAAMCRAVADPEGYSRRLAAIEHSAKAPVSDRITLRSGQVLERVTRPQLRRGVPNGRVWAYRDRTELVTAGRRIEALATTDALTGLINRRRLGELLTQLLGRVRSARQPLALLLVDLDRFKQVNDSLGDEVGDRILLATADRLRDGLRAEDQVARVGGDQFALLLPGAGARGAEAAAQRVLDAVSAPHAVGGLQFTLTCSVGVALHPSDGDDADEIVRHAETAMKRAKAGGRAGFRFHRPEHETDLRHRMRLDHAMRQALASNRFRLKYQPQVDLASGAVTGAEALLRWRDPELGEVSPGEFIPVAEDTGFIVAIGDWVLAQAARQCARWRAQGFAVPVAVNVSALQFQRPDFVEHVAQVLRDNALEGQWLELELTESILLHEADEALQRLSALAALGVRLAIDDFGTGWSSLGYLKRFPIARLKIDRSFVKGLPADDSDAAIVRAIIRLGRALGMQVVAEGVETPPQRSFLAEAGCDAFQGFLYAPALDALSFEERLRGRGLAARPPVALVARAAN